MTRLRVGKDEPLQFEVDCLVLVTRWMDLGRLRWIRFVLVVGGHDRKGWCDNGRRCV